MDRDERIAELRAEIAHRSPTISNLPAGHVTRDALLAECAAFTAEIETLKNEAPSAFGTRLVATVFVGGGLYLAFTLDSPWLWAGVTLSVLGSLIFIGA